MSKFSVFNVIFVLFVVLESMIVHGQIYPEEVPPELQYLLNWDLDTWRAPDVIRKAFPYYLSGFDDENRPIWVNEFGKYDIRTIMETENESLIADLERHIAQAMWNMYNSTGIRKFPDEERVTEVVGILDAEGYDIRQFSHRPTLDFVIKQVRLITIAMRFASSAYILNTNYAADRLVNTLKPILGKEFDKFEIYGTNRQLWIPKLLRNIPKDQVPSWYGGPKNFKPYKVYG